MQAHFFIFNINCCIYFSMYTRNSELFLSGCVYRSSHFCKTSQQRNLLNFIVINCLRTVNHHQSSEVVTKTTRPWWMQGKYLQSWRDLYCRSLLEHIHMQSTEAANQQCLFHCLSQTCATHGIFDQAGETI